MNPVHFGVFMSPDAAHVGEVRANVHVAEREGFDFVSIQDHPYVANYLDTFSLIAVLATETSRLRFVTDVANLPLRPAPMLAKAAATIDLLSGGRFELGLGGGRAWEQIVGLGGPHWTPGETVTATSEAIDALRALWEPGRVLNQPEGHFPLVGIESGPAPAHRIDIWLGATGPRMLGVLGAKADGWIAPISTDFDTKPSAQLLIDDAARAAGREPSEVRRVIQLIGSVVDRGETTTRPTTGPGRQAIHATPEIWAQIITEFIVDERFDTINLFPQGALSEQLERFGREVIPLVRGAR